MCLNFRTPSGALGTASWNFCSGIWEDVVDIVGELGCITFACFNNKPVRLEVSARLKPPATNVGQEPPAVERLKDPEVSEHQAEQPDHVHQPLVEAVLQDLHQWVSIPADSQKKADAATAAHAGACSSTGTSAARTALIMDKALEDFYGGVGSRDTAFWETPDKWANRA